MFSLKAAFEISFRLEVTVCFELHGKSYDSKYVVLLNLAEWLDSLLPKVKFIHHRLQVHLPAYVKILPCKDYMTIIQCKSLLKKLTCCRKE